MPHCLIGLGANLGNRHGVLRQAVELLAQDDRLRLLQVSRWHETQPAGGPAGQPAYLNGAATIETALAPDALLAVLHKIEDRLGRRRQEHWAARSLDLDLLLYGDHVERSASLVVPHPRMAWRRFVLDPAAEIAPSMVHPVIGWSVARLLAHLNVSPPYVAVTGIVGAVQTDFARRVAEACSADRLFDSRMGGTEQHTAVGFHVAPSGRGPAVELECLRRRARQLAVADPRWSRPDRWTVSDFWFDESRAWAACPGWSGRPSVLFDVWRRLATRVVRPRLVVVLDVSARQLRSWTRPSGLELVILNERRRALDRQLRRGDVGPILLLADPESKESLDEVVAAIQAMA